MNGPDRESPRPDETGGKGKRQTNTLNALSKLSLDRRLTPVKRKAPVKPTKKAFCPRCDRPIEYYGAMGEWWCGTVGHKTYGADPAPPPSVIPASEPGRQAEASSFLAGVFGREVEAGEETPRFPRTDAGNGELFAHLHGDHLRFDHRRKRWLLWEGHWWHPDADAEVRRLAKDAARHRYHAGAAVDDLKEREAEARFAINSESRMRLEAMLALGQAECPIADAGEGWDTDPWTMGVANGIVDLRTGTLRAGRQEDRITLHSPVAYNPDASCSQWLAFLVRIMAGNADLIGFLQRAVGYSLTGNVSEQVLFFLHGTGANGKSTFLGAILDMLGDYGRQAAPGLLTPKRGETHPTEYADLMGSRLVASLEVEEGRRLAEAMTKWLTGGDRMKARFMRQDFFEFTPTYKLFLAANHKPTIIGTDLAIWRRIKLVPFTVEIPEEEQDGDLPTKLREELPGILCWAVKGCLLWQEGGLCPPDEVRAATEAYRTEQDVLGDFIADCCRTGQDEKVTANALYIAYTNWCKDSGERPRSKTAFGRRLAERGFASDRTMRDRWWYGLSVFLPQMTGSDGGLDIK